MANDAKGISPIAQPQGLDEALEALGAAAQALRSVSLHEEARQVDALVDRLGPGRRLGSPSVFRSEGEYRVVLYEGDVFRIRETVGLAYLAKLLANPGREIHVLELVGSDAGLNTDAGPVLDAEARRAYRRRIEELAGDLVDAERANDMARAEQYREELELLRVELSRGEGLGGRERLAGSNSERARQAVTKALKSALARIAAHSPALGRHLASTVRTGTYCRYLPDTRLPIGWRF